MASIVSRPDVSRGWAADAAWLCALKLAIGAWVLAHGFTHVSDDDYARTVIAEQFAHAPHLDPSGTSWLPLPFWLEGSVMAAAGRSLEVARAVAMALGAAGGFAAYAAMRAVAIERATAGAATVVAMALPWNAWLGVATVPEGWVGAVTAAAVVAAGNARVRPSAAVALLAASLSRYEAWPACAVVAALCVANAVRAASVDPRHATGRERAIGREIACAVVAASGPLLWMAHNALAHGDALHFLARVSAFRRAIGAADVPMRDKLLGYPRSLLEDTPEVAVLGIAGAIGIATSQVLRRRWAVPAAACAAIVAFLVWGDIKDGAPTHHPARALVAVWWIFAGMGVDAVFAGVRALGSTVRIRIAMGAGAVAAVAWLAWLVPRWNDAPGRSEYDQRQVQIARGLDMRARGVEHAAIAPCSFEHFALLAAWGAPERADISPRTGEPPTRACPGVAER